MFPKLKPSLAPLVLRLGLASIFLYHSYLKLGQNGGTDWCPDLLPSEVQVMVAWMELLGALAIGFGVLSRVAALAFAIEMIAAIILVTGKREFVDTRRFVPDLAYRFEHVGYEYNFAIVVICLTLIVLGSGQWSVDYFIFRKKGQPAMHAVPKP